MKMEALSAVVKELFDPPSWLGASSVEWSCFVEAMSDGVVVRAEVSDRCNEWVDGIRAEGRLDGRLLRVVANDKAKFLDVVDRLVVDIVSHLHGHYVQDTKMLPLMCEALQSEGAADVLADALLIDGAITVHDPPLSLSEAERSAWVTRQIRRTATNYARHVVGHRIFDSFSTDPWPLPLENHRQARQWMADILRPLWPES